MSAFDRRPDAVCPAPASATRPELVHQLERAEASLAAAPNTDIACRRAILLDRLGRVDDAKAAFLDVLAQSPDHADSLNAFGALLYRTGYRRAARSVFLRVVASHPELPVGRVNLGNVLRQEGELAAARHEFIEALRLSPDLAQAHQGYGDLLTECGEHDAAALHWRLGYRDHALHGWIFRGTDRPVRVLMPISVANGNIAARFLLDDQVFAVTTLAMEFYRDEADLPPHDLVLNAIGDADLCQTALLAAEDLLERRIRAPVLNHPERVLATGRADLANTLRNVAGIVVPKIATVSRAALLQSTGPGLLAAEGFTFPLLLRTPGFHTGRHFVRVDTAADLAREAACLPGHRVLAIAYLPGGWSDGCARKGRVMFIDGRLYPLHWAISRDWKVHYFTADMENSAEHRREEQQFLADTTSFLGRAAVESLAAIAAALGLDYGGIDFGVSADGKILLFEANATMAIVPPPPSSLWNYRRPAADLALLAAKNMLITRSARQAPT
jgi:tetratricopeptide (TPR) repeat protein